MSFEPATHQIDEFSERGFVIIRKLFDDEEMASLLSVAKCDQKLLGQSYARRDGAGGESKLAVRNELVESPYSAIVRSFRVAGTMAQLLSDEVYHYHHKMMLKEPRVGGAWEWHQDYGYWYQNGCLYPDMGSCLITLDQATVANGCLQVIVGSHKMGRIDHQKSGDQTAADPDRVAAALDRMELVHCELDPGDAIFFHANLLHRSDQNTSEKPRWSLICCYNTRHNDPYFVGKHPNYEPLEIWPDQKVTQYLLAQSF